MPQNRMKAVPKSQKSSRTKANPTRRVTGIETLCSKSRRPAPLSILTIDDGLGILGVDRFEDGRTVAEAIASLEDEIDCLQEAMEWLGSFDDDQSVNDPSE